MVRHCSCWRRSGNRARLHNSSERVKQGQTIALFNSRATYDKYNMYIHVCIVMYIHVLVYAKHGPPQTRPPRPLTTRKSLRSRLYFAQHYHCLHVYTLTTPFYTGVRVSSWYKTKVTEVKQSGRKDISALQVKLAKVTSVYMCSTYICLVWYSSQPAELPQSSVAEHSSREQCHGFEFYLRQLIFL